MKDLRRVLWMNKDLNPSRDMTDKDNRSISLMSLYHCTIINNSNTSTNHKSIYIINHPNMSIRSFNTRLMRIFWMRFIQENKIRMIEDFKLQNLVKIHSTLKFKKKIQVLDTNLKDNLANPILNFLKLVLIMYVGVVYNKPTLTWLLRMIITEATSNKAMQSLHININSSFHKLKLTSQTDTLAISSKGTLIIIRDLKDLEIMIKNQKVEQSP